MTPTPPDLLRRLILGAGLGLFATRSAAQAPAPPTPQGPAPAPQVVAPARLAAPAPGMVRVRLSTALGSVTLDLNAAKAPITTANFLRYVDQKRFDGATFYRASRTPGAPEFGVVQGGLQNDPKRILPPIAHEPTTKTGLSHQDGTISMGRHKPGTATADFFICVGESTYLDADPKAEGDNKGYAAFGQVVEGMDVVRTILALPTSATGGVGVMKGEMLRRPVVISRARRIG